MKQALVLALALSCATLTAAPISPGVHAMVLDIAASLGVPRSVADALQIEESGWYKTGAWGDSEAIGPVDCYDSRSRGLFAISQRWQTYLVGKYYPHPPGLFDVFNPTDNALVALGYLADLHRRYGTWERALWFYNCGRVTGVPQSTREYAKRIINWTKEGR